MPNNPSNRTVRAITDRAAANAVKNAVTLQSIQSVNSIGATMNTAKRLTLNIGLVYSQRFGEVARARVLNPVVDTVQTLRIPQVVAGIVLDLLDAGFEVLQYRVAQSGTEPTLVIEVVKHDEVIYSPLLRLSKKYAQDCISVQDSLGGELIGLYASAWGEFNSEYFINI